MKRYISKYMKILIKKLTRPILRWSGRQREWAWQQSSCRSESSSCPTSWSSPQGADQTWCTRNTFPWRYIWYSSHPSHYTDDKEFAPKFTRQLYWAVSSTIIKFNLFTELCVARLTGNEGRKLLLGLGWAEIRFDQLLLGLAGTRE